ncbi:cytochrome c-type biogenesis protein [Mesobacillus zeae]|uniref:Cytochrome c-type biogenesis protein n=1 Tax=Mesobacillus zeae TaxID=1917180 RepID=A0A398B2A7_9BACI|nr:cytochrome c-type biogenesis protein [Mesobacillus zeae]RID83892.1 cytochrome c-type biogenesis protein CcmH [Mesobacillus zeae]
MRKLLSICFIAILFVLQAFLLNTHATSPDGEYDYKSAEFKAVAAQFLCTCGCGQSHYDCDMAGCNNTDAFKKDILTMMKKGMDKDEIRHYYVKTLGEEILMAPDSKGFSLAAWVMPFAALGGAGTGVFVVIRRWVKRRDDTKTLEEDLKEADEVEGEIMSSMIEKERKKYL